MIDIILLNAGNLLLAGFPPMTCSDGNGTPPQASPAGASPMPRQACPDTAKVGLPLTKKGGIAPALPDRTSAAAYLISPIEMLRYSTFILTPPCTWRPTGAAWG